MQFLPDSRIIRVTRSFLVISTLMISSLSPIIFNQKAAALSGSEFNASNIIDDSVFFAPGAMSDNEIQAFLNAKVPTCDTNGIQASNGTTRAVYGASRGYPAPYTCLKDYVQNIPGIGADAYCGNVGSGSVSAAQIIGAVSRACGVNPKVMLVLLQKEQSFITDDWPWPIQYTKATGMGCPDSALGLDVDANQNGCYDEYEGFFKQIYYAARQFKRYIQQPQSFSYAAGRNSYVAYNANRPDCSGTNITPQNGATAALYNYTPYQPNAAALANLYGTGDDCSAYGNRNFWRMFNDWFGSVRTNETWAWSIVSQEVFSDSGRLTPFSDFPTVAPGGKFYARVRVMNVGTQTWQKSFLRIGTSSPRDRASLFYGTGWSSPNRAASTTEDTVLPGQLATFDITYTAPSTPGTYREYFNLVADGRSWLNGPTLYYPLNVVIPASPVGIPSQYILNSGEELRPGDYKLSPDKHSMLSMQRDGNIVLYRNFRAVWSSMTSGKTVSRLALQIDGNMVLYGPNNAVLWQTATSNAGESQLAIQTDGNMVLYKKSDNSPAFSTSTISVPDQLSYASNTLPVGLLYVNQQLESTNRKYRLVLQGDGNLVLYSNSNAIWTAGTFGQQVSLLSMQGDGNLVLYNSAGRAVWWSQGTFGKNGNQLRIQDDGNLVVYTSGDTATWYTGTFGR